MPEVVFFSQLGLLILFGRLLGEGMQRIGQPAVMGQLLAGIIFGPSVFGLLWPEAQSAIFPRSAEQKSMIEAISQLGILMLLLLTGMETDLKLVTRVRRPAIAISVAGVALPFLGGFMLGEMLPNALLPRPDSRFITALFLGTALSISSVKIVAMVVREMNFMRRNLGQIIVASAITEDTIGWIIIAVAFGLASSGKIEGATVLRIVCGTAVFLILSLTFGRWVVFNLIRWANDNFVTEFPVITMILVIMIVMALTTHLIGVHTVLGAFVAGILVGESPILTRHIDAQLRGLIVALFMPTFFGLSGLGADLTILKNGTLFLLTVCLVAVASMGKFAGAFLGATVGGLSRQEALAIACGMNARGSTEVIVATIGLSTGVLNRDLFTMIVAMAIITTMAMPPMLRWALARVPLSDSERKRIEREELDAKGFVTNLERLLLAADASANGKLASLVAGLIAGSGSKPTTVVELGKNLLLPRVPNHNELHEGAVRDAAQSVVPLSSHPDEGGKGKVDVITRSKDGPADQLVADEAKKGYDLLVIGVEATRAVNGGFTETITRIANSFEGPMAILFSRSPRPPLPFKRILVPVNGSETSRRAAEVAFVIGRLQPSQVTALYVASGSSGSDGAKRQQDRGSWNTRRFEEAVLKGITEMADELYRTRIRTAIRVDRTAEHAILKEMPAYDLVVLGVTRRPGDTLFFGSTAAAVLENSRQSILFLGS
jgi:Kef-type K+ transport system membrane component KefB/nucleotide-binding universal stress UspA family protein